MAVDSACARMSEDRTVPTIIDVDFMVCTDCLMIIANDDASGLNYSLGEEDVEA